MTTLTPDSPYSPHSPCPVPGMNRLRDQAHAEAHLLRAQAIRNFWRGAWRLG